jgi:hypothetical protein
LSWSLLTKAGQGPSLRSKDHDNQKPHRTGVVTAKRPKRSGGAPKALDDAGPMWPRGFSYARVEDARLRRAMAA